MCAKALRYKKLIVLENHKVSLSSWGLWSEKEQDIRCSWRGGEGTDSQCFISNDKDCILHAVTEVSKREIYEPIYT